MSITQMSALDLHVELRPQKDNHYELTLTFNDELVPTAASATVTCTQQIQIDWERAYRHAGDATEMGRWLGELIFGAEPAERLLEQALASAAGLETAVRCRLTLPAELQSLPWETLYTSKAGLLAASEKILFSRFLRVDNYRPAVRLRREALKVSLAVAAPDGLKSYNLPRPDAASLANRLREAVGEDRLRRVPATRGGLLKTLRDGAGILCLAAHGAFPRGSREPFVFLAGERGEVARVPAADLAEDLASLDRLPRLIVLLSCHSAGSDAALGSPDEALLSLGAQLVTQGAPAVVAIRGSISFATAGEFLASFFAELRRDWVIDRAMGAARRDILERQDAWAPVLFMRLADGWLARPTAFEATFAPPPLPPDYVHRPAAHEAVVERLLPGTVSDEPQAVGITTTALTGAGGFGKTTLAQAICNDARLIEAFPDGILWLTLGERPGNLLDLVNRLTTYLSGSLATEANLVDAHQALAASTETQRLLFVVDDVWQAEHARPFLINRPGCVILLTTRNSKTLPDSAARIIVESMAREEAVALLRQGITDGSGLAWNDVAHRLGDWPLLLKLANSALRDRLRQGLNPEQAVADLIQTYDSLGITGFDVQDSQERQTAVSRSLAMSTGRLETAASYGQHVVDEVARFQELGIFAEDVDIPVETLAVYWRPFGFDEVMVRRLCQRLFDLSLLLQFDRQGDSVRLHDVIRKYLAENGLAKGLHQRLVGSYRDLSEPDWQAFPDHAYMAEYAPYHMRAADRRDDLSELLFSFAWMRCKLAVTYIKWLATDYDELGDTTQPAVRHVAEALRLIGGLISEDNEFPGQLYGRLIGAKSPQVKSLIRQIEARTDTPWLRPRLPVQGKPGGALLLKLKGLIDSSQPDLIVAVNRSGTLAAIGEGSTVSVLDLENGILLHYWIRAHADQVTAICFEPGDKYLVTAGGKRDARGRSVRQSRTRRRSPLQSHLRTRSDERMERLYPPENHVKIWSLADGALQHTLKGHEDSVTCVAASLDARVVVSGSADLTVRVWDGISGECLQTHRDHKDTILEVGVSQDGKSIISVGLDQFVQLWDEKHEKAGQFRLHSHYDIQARSHDVAINADQGVIASMTGDIILLWDVADANGVMRSYNRRDWDLDWLSGAIDRKTLGADEIIRAPGGKWFGRVAISEAGDTVVATSGPDLYVWERGKRKLRHRLRQRGGRITVLAIDGEARIAVTVSDITGVSEGVTVWDISKPAGEKKKREMGSITAVATSSQSGSVALGTSRGEVFLIDRTKGKIGAYLQRISLIRKAITKLPLLEIIFLPLLLVTLDNDDMGEDAEFAQLINKGRALWNRLVPGSLRRPVEHLIDGIDEWLSVTAITVSADGNRVAVGFDNGLVKVWRKRLLGGWALQARWRATIADDDIEQIALVDENSLLTAADFDGVATWEIKSGRLLARFEAEYVYFLRGEQMQALVASDKDFITRRTDKENDLHLRLVDLRSGQIVHEVNCAEVQAVALDRSGLVFALTDDNKNYWWDLDQGTQTVAGEAEMWDEFAGEDTLILDNKQLLLSRGSRSLEIIDVSRAEAVAKWTSLSRITTHTVDWDDKQLIFGTAAGDIQILELMNAPET